MGYSLHTREMGRSVGALASPYDRESSQLLFPPFVQIPHRLPGFWLSDPVCGSGHQGHSGVSGSQVERSDYLTSEQED